jgi:hypothetical protein
VAPSNVKLLIYGPDHDAAPYELADHVAHVLVIAPQAIDPTANEHVASTKFVGRRTPEDHLLRRIRSSPLRSGRAGRDPGFVKTRHARKRVE